MSYYSNPSTASLSNPSTLGGGSEIDYNIPDDPTIRVNIGNTDEKDAFVRTGIGTTLDKKTEDTYGVEGLVPPDQAGGTVGVQYLDPSQVAALTAAANAAVQAAATAQATAVEALSTLRNAIATAAASAGFTTAQITAALAASDAQIRTRQCSGCRICRICLCCQISRCKSCPDCWFGSSPHSSAKS
jgi:hypothetical protein